MPPEPANTAELERVLVSIRAEKGRVNRAGKRALEPGTAPLSELPWTSCQFGAPVCSRLYKEEYDSFEVYCREKWHYGRRHVYQLISAAELFTHLCASCAHCKPDHESQLRPLVGLTPEEAQLAWTCAVETAGGRKITARIVKKAMQDLGLAAPPKPVSKINRNAKAERCKLINDTIGQLLLLISQRAAYEKLLQQVETLQHHIQPLLSDATPRRTAAT